MNYFFPSVLKSKDIGFLAMSIVERDEVDCEIHSLSLHLTSTSAQMGSHA